MSTSPLRLLAAALLAVASLGACAEPGPGPEPLSTSTHALTACDTPATPASPCDEGRMIAYFGDVTNDEGVVTCPAVPPVGAGDTPDWVEARVFDADFGDLPRQLTLYCAYTWQHATGPSASDLAELEAELGFEGATHVDPDCAVVASQKAPLAKGPAVVPPLGDWTPELLHQLNDSWRDQAGAFYPLPPLSAFDGAPPATPVRVAVIDSAVAFSANNGRDLSGHGTAVAAAIQDLGCRHPSTPCAVQTAASLALPYTSVGEKNEARGGYFGDFASLADGVFQAVAAWDPASNGRLLLNLSVGWEDDEAYPATGDMHAGVRAVHDALRFARCRGALILAAAGNDAAGGNKAPGPTYPGGWETEPAQSKLASCEALDGVVYTPPTSTLPAFAKGQLEPGFYGPLLYAVGAIDVAHRPIQLSRPGGLPGLLAAGHQVVGWPYKWTGKTETALSGTSMSTATASGIAATAWAYRADLSPDELMGQLYAASAAPGSVDADVGGPLADFCFGGTPECLHRSRRVLRLCPSLQAVAGVVCQAPAAAEVAPPTLPDSFVAAVRTSSDTVKAKTQATDVQSCTSAVGCDTPTEVCAPNGYGVPWVQQQPTVPPCPACQLTAGQPNLSSSATTRYTAVLIPPDPGGPIWTATEITVEYAAATRVYSIGNGIPITPTGPAVLTHVGLPCNNVGIGPQCGWEILSASLSGVVGTELSGTVQVLVHEPLSGI